MYNIDEIAKEADKLATIWQNRANALQTPQEKARHAKLETDANWKRMVAGHLLLLRVAGYGF